MTPHESSCTYFSLELELELKNLRIQNRMTQGFKYTKGSAANIISGVRQYLYFTLHYKITPLPTSVDTLVCFLEFMARTSSHPHLKHLLSSVKFVHEAMDLKFPVNSFQLDLTLQGLKRRLARVPFQVLPMTPNILKKMYSHLDVSNNKDRGEML